MDQIVTSTSGSLQFRQIGATFAAEVTGMPIRGDVVPELLSQFVSLLHRFRVLIVPGAEVEPGDLVAFSRRFGPLEIHSRFENTLPTHREIFCVGNVERDGNLGARRIARALDRPHQRLDRLLVGGKRRPPATLIRHTL